MFIGYGLWVIEGWKLRVESLKFRSSLNYDWFFESASIQDALKNDVLNAPDCVPYLGSLKVSIFDTVEKLVCYYTRATWIYLSNFG